MKWFTADQHFGHKNIIEYCDRPFKTVEQMDEQLIYNHNFLVGPKDEVYHLGDFTMANTSMAKDYLDQLNGTHYHITGNHDRKNMEQAGFSWSKDVYRLRTGLDRIWLSHYAHRVWPSKHYGDPHLFGHSHGMLPHHYGSLDVGVDCWGYGPISLNRVIQVIKERDEEVRCREISA